MRVSKEKVIKALSGMIRSNDFRGNQSYKTSNTEWTVTGCRARSREEVLAIDWTQEVHGKDHPVPMAVTPDTLFNMETGEVMARAEPGFRFYWFHSHPHIAPDNWDNVFPCREFNEPVKNMESRKGGV